MKRISRPGYCCSLLLLFYGLFTGCKPELNIREDFKLPAAPPPLPEPGEIRTGLLYYPDRQWRFLVPLQREIPEAETIVRNTLEKLFNTPRLQEELEPLGLVPLLPGETAILGIHIDEGVGSGGLAGSFLDYNLRRAPGLGRPLMHPVPVSGD